MNKGFTLIELVMVIVILGILAAVAVPKFVDLQKQAKDASTKGVIGAVKSGIGVYYASNFGIYPDVLDSATSGQASQTNQLFTTVLSQGGITDASWNKISGTEYKAPNDCTYIYTPTTGEFSAKQ